ncbi:hypothetical protein C8J56DRAFT_943113, partial [Mycena floridula]
MQPKKRRGRPPVSADGEDGSKHPYLQNADGDKISRDELGRVGKQARRLFNAFAKCDRAPESWGRVDQLTHDYYSAHMMTEFIFFRYADGPWKLDLWTQRYYPSWARTSLTKTDKDSANTSRPTKRRRTSDPEQITKLDETGLISMDDNLEFEVPMTPDSTATTLSAPDNSEFDIESQVPEEAGPALTVDPEAAVLPFSTTSHEDKIIFQNPLDEMTFDDLSKPSMSVPNSAGSLLPSQIQNIASSSTAPARGEQIISVVKPKAKSTKPSVALAQLGAGLTAKNFCMKDWLKTNPGGLKLTFETYWSDLPADARKVFETEARAASSAAQRQKRSVKKASSTITPSQTLSISTTSSSLNLNDSTTM